MISRNPNVSDNELSESFDQQQYNHMAQQWRKKGNQPDEGRRIPQQKVTPKSGVKEQMSTTFQCEGGEEEEEEKRIE